VGLTFPAGGDGALVQNMVALDRDVDVFVIKQLKTSRLEVDTEYKEFTLKYQEFLSTIRGALDYVLTRNAVILQPIISYSPGNAFVPIASVGTDASVKPLFANARYIDVIALGIINLARPAWTVRVQSSKMNGIEDVLSVSCRISTTGVGTASISIKNDTDKFTFKKNSLLAGRTIFEPDDIVVVRLPDKDNQPHNSFVGFVNAVERQRAPAQNIINLECEDVTKRLRFSRTAIRKALIDRDPEAQFASLSAFIFPWVQGEGGGAEAVQKVVSNVTALAMSTINDLPNLVNTINTYTTLFKKRNFFSTEPNPTQKGPGVVGSSGNELASELQAARKSIETERSNSINQYIDTPPSQTVWKIIAGSASVYRNTKSLVTAQSANFYKKPIMVIEGTDQPAYQIAFRNGFDLWMSEWKETNKLIQEFANVIYFEFFSNEDGIIRFRPINLGLSHLVTSDLNVIKDTDVYRETTYENNSDIANIAVVVGNWKQRFGSGLDAIGIFGYIKDNRLIKKYGEKMLNLQPVIGLTTNASLNVWATSVLTRINRKAYAGGSVEIVGNSQIRVGSYVYLQGTNALYYVDSIEHSVSPGQRYTMRLNLTYRRLPVFDLALLLSQRRIPSGFAPTQDAQRAVAVQSLNYDIKQNGRITIMQGSDIMLAYAGVTAFLKTDGYSEDEIQRIYNPKGSSSPTDIAANLQLFYYNGYIWEFGVDIDFAKALATETAFTTAQTSADTKSQQTQTSLVPSLPPSANYDKMDMLTRVPTA